MLFPQSSLKLSLVRRVLSGLVVCTLFAICAAKLTAQDVAPLKIKEQLRVDAVGDGHTKIELKMPAGT